MAINPHKIPIFCRRFVFSRNRIAPNTVVKSMRPPLTTGKVITLVNTPAKYVLSLFAVPMTAPKSRELHNTLFRFVLSLGMPFLLSFMKSAMVKSRLNRQVNATATNRKLSTGQAFSKAYSFCTIPIPPENNNAQSTKTSHKKSAFFPSFFKEVERIKERIIKPSPTICVGRIGSLKRTTPYKVGRINPHA